MQKKINPVLEAVDEQELMHLCRELLRIPSFSGKEEKVARFLYAKMKKVGMEVELQRVPPHSIMKDSSVNAIGRLKGDSAGTKLLFNGHMDHNPVLQGWNEDPFHAVVKKGWLYGFIHMKAALAAYIAALQAFKETQSKFAGEIIIANVCGELSGGVGTKYALAHGLSADYFVLGEPTELQLGLNHSASLVFKIHTIGRSKHFATVDVAGVRGISAIEKMTKVLHALGKSHTPQKPRAGGGWLSFRPAPGFKGLPQINVGNVIGGLSSRYDMSRPALVPDYCTITVDVRIVPGMSIRTVSADLERVLRGIAREDPDFRYEVERTTETFPYAFQAQRDSRIVQSVAKGHEAVLGNTPNVSRELVPAASDASWMARGGISGIVYGPSGKYLSRPDERCEFQDIVNAAKVYAYVMSDLCAPKR